MSRQSILFVWKWVCIIIASLALGYCALMALLFSCKHHGKASQRSHASSKVGRFCDNASFHFNHLCVVKTAYHLGTIGVRVRI